MERHKHGATDGAHDPRGRQSTVAIASLDRPATTFAKRITPALCSVEAPGAGSTWPGSAPTCDPNEPHIDWSHPTFSRIRETKHLLANRVAGAQVQRSGFRTIPSGFGGDHVSSLNASAPNWRLRGRRVISGSHMPASRALNFCRERCTLNQHLASILTVNWSYQPAPDRHQQHFSFV